MQALLPVAGVGTRLRPHTYTRPKAMVHVAGKPVLGHILDRLVPVGVEEVILIVGPGGDQIKAYVEREYPFKVTAVPQKERLGLGHAVFTGRDAVDTGRPLFIVLGDTIFQSRLDDVVTGPRSAIGVRRVENPRQFGVVELEGERIRRLVEKPDVPPSDLAIVGLYYIRETDVLFRCLQDIIDEDVRVKGEYQLTDALQRMLDQGVEMGTFPVDDWWDCGNPTSLLAANRDLLDMAGTTPPAVPGSVIIPPVSIDPSAEVEGCIVGPYVSVAAGVRLRHSVLRDTIVNEGARVESLLLENSLIGADAEVTGAFNELNVGDSSGVHL